MHPPIYKFYDQNNARALVAASQVSYGDAETILQWAALMECTACEIIEDASTQTRVFVAAAEKFVIVCFRGTTNLRNWLTDLDARRVPLPWPAVNTNGAKVHEGFLTALETVWPQLAETISRLAARTRTVFFTGHSLGGALAMLAAARWAGDLGGPANNELAHYSFGQPRVGNAAWARWCDARLGGRSFRVLHSDDIVARVPWLLKAYRHAGVEVFYPTFSTVPSAYIIDCPWWRKLPCDLIGFYREWRQGQLALLADHHVDTYVRLLNPSVGRDSVEPWNKSSYRCSIPGTALGDHGSTESRPTGMDCGIHQTTFQPFNNQ